MEEGAGEPRVGYRTDIQGLRAIAIVLVVVCHAGIALPGGFIGVDVFFVISGFVIGAMLVRELHGTNAVSFRGFYAKRARRLLPSLAVVLVVGVVVGIFVLNPSTSQEIPFRTAGAASIFVSNLYLYRHVGYFDATSDGSNPFLHLWSLSVEEQFYLVLPLLVFGAWRLSGRVSGPARHRRMALVIAVVSVGSFWLSWAMTSGHSPIDVKAPVRFAFYGAPTRIWELGAGVLLALGAGLVERVPARLAGAAGALGALTVLGSAARIDPLQPFPGVAALPAVVGTLLLLVAGARSGLVERLLSWRPLAWIGDRSYGWYLWHWPMIVYARILWPGADLAPVVAGGLSLMVAAGVHAAFEDRIRRDSRIRGARAAVLAAVCIALPLVVVLGALHGKRGGWGVEEPSDWYDTPTGRQVGCVLVNRDMANAWPEDACVTDPPGGESPVGTILVLGDFHADSISTAVISAAADRGYRVAEWARASCPFTAAAPAGYPACARWQGDARELIERLDPDLVVIGNRSTGYTTDVDRQVGSNAGRILALDGSRTGSDAEAADAWGAALRQTLGELDEQEIPVLVVGAAPSYRDDFPTPSLLRPSLEPPSRPRNEVDADHDAVVSAELRAVASSRVAAYVDPVPLLCGPETCSPYEAGHWRYYDAFNLNNIGSEVLEPEIARAMDRLLADRP